MNGCLRVGLFALALVGPVWSAGQTVRVLLPHGLSLELPQSWQINDEPKLALLQSLQTSGPTAEYDASMEEDFAATFVSATRSDTDSNTVNAKIDVRYLTDTRITQSQAARLNDEQLVALDNAVRDVTATGLNVENGRILAWLGTRKQQIAGLTAAVSEYRRSSTSTADGSFDVRIVRIFNGAKSFTVTLGYRESGKYTLRPLCDRVLASIRLGGSVKN